MSEKISVSYFGNSPKKNGSSFKIFILSVVGFVIFGLGPLIADQLTGNSTSTNTSETSTVESAINQNASPTPDPTILLDPELQNSAAVDSQSQESNSSYSPSPSPTKIPPHAVANQEMILKLPKVVRVDPRAKMATLPQVSFDSLGSPYLMLCMNSSRQIIDLDIKGNDDSNIGKDFFLIGDRSSGIQISGLADQVLTVFNGSGGLRILSNNGQGVVGTYLYLKFVAISEPTDNFDICATTENAQQWSLEVQPLGLQIVTKKNSVSLGDKKSQKP